MIQPILENAIYYGVGNMDEDDDGMIIVTGEKRDEDILITIEDNGMGMREEVLENILTDSSKVPKHGSGVGVINVHSRIRLMFGEEYGLFIESEPDEGTKSRFVFLQSHTRRKMQKHWNYKNIYRGDRQMKRIE